MACRDDMNLHSRPRVTRKAQLARALFDNPSECAGELEFRRGDLLTVLQSAAAPPPGWRLCSLRGQQGICPRNRLLMLTEATDADFHSNSHLVRSGSLRLASSSPSRPSPRWSISSLPGPLMTCRDHSPDVYDIPPSPRPIHAAAAGQDYDVPRSGRNHAAPSSPDRSQSVRKTRVAAPGLPSDLLWRSAPVSAAPAPPDHPRREAPVRSSSLERGQLAAAPDERRELPGAQRSWPHDGAEQTSRGHNPARPTGCGAADVFGAAESQNPLKASPLQHGTPLSQARHGPGAPQAALRTAGIETARGLSRAPQAPERTATIDHSVDWTSGQINATGGLSVHGAIRNRLSCVRSPSARQHFTENVTGWETEIPTPSERWRGDQPAVAANDSASHRTGSLHSSDSSLSSSAGEWNVLPLAVAACRDTLHALESEVLAAVSRLLAGVRRPGSPAATVLTLQLDVTRLREALLELV
ncbi:cas scaffolding protein family member 4-like, partial [Pollicipes pollicipes]|uniref:cas scaffolding protein family member 4-like n=1 Tax=Pollicipes pollicipes TaxID=41117 RepID=UPI001884DE90